MSTLIPWWQSLVTGAVGGSLTLLGSFVAQLWTGRHARAERADRARQRRAEAYAQYLSAHQRLIVAIDQFLLRIAENTEVEIQWATLSTTGYEAMLLSQSRELVNEVNELMRSALPLIRLVREGSRDMQMYVPAIARYNEIGDRLGELMREDSVGQSYWPRGRFVYEEIESGKSQSSAEIGPG